MLLIYGNFLFKGIFRELREWRVALVIGESWHQLLMIAFLAVFYYGPPVGRPAFRALDTTHSLTAESKSSSAPWHLCSAGTQWSNLIKNDQKWSNIINLVKQLWNDKNIFSNWLFHSVTAESKSFSASRYLCSDCTQWSNTEWEKNIKA